MMNSLATTDIFPLSAAQSAMFPPFRCRSSVAVSPFCRSKIPLFRKNYARKFRSVTDVNSKKIRNGSGNSVWKRQRLTGTAKRQWNGGNRALVRVLVDHRWRDICVCHCVAAEVGGCRRCHLAMAVLSATTSNQWASSSPVDLQPTTVSPSGSSVANSPSLKTASSTRVLASRQRSTPNTSASFQTGLLVCRFVVVFFRFRLAVVAGLLLPTPIITVTRTSGPTKNASSTEQRRTWLEKCCQRQCFKNG